MCQNQANASLKQWFARTLSVILMKTVLFQRRNLSPTAYPPHTHTHNRILLVAWENVPPCAQSCAVVRYKAGQAAKTGQWHRYHEAPPSLSADFSSSEKCRAKGSLSPENTYQWHERTESLEFLHTSLSKRSWIARPQCKRIKMKILFRECGGL